jgi:uncharacterized membrane protein
MAMVSTDLVRKRQAEDKSRARNTTVNRAQYILAFLILLLTTGITVGREVLLSMRFDAGFLQIALIAIVVSMLTAHRSLLFIVLVLGISFAVNLPAAVLDEHGVNKSVLLGTLAAIILEPFLKRFFK